MSIYFVSRQNYWGLSPEDSHIVEICIGGRDYANADMLGAKWPHLGEGQEFRDPREAVEAAIRICDEWKKTEPHAMVGLGATMGFSAPFQGEDYDTLRSLAERLYQNLPKCTMCEELLGKQTYTHDFADEDKFCSSNCAEKSLAKLELMTLHENATAIFKDASLSWEEKYDEFFRETENESLAQKVFRMIRLDNYVDPDGTYEEDVTAFMTAFNEKMKDE